MAVYSRRLKRARSPQCPGCARQNQKLRLYTTLDLCYIDLYRSYDPNTERKDAAVTANGLAFAQERLDRAFTPHRPIDVPEFFAGRLNLLYRANDAANTSGLHIVLFGDRGTGKTSIARVLAHRLQEPERKDGRRTIFTSCNSSDTYSSIWRRVFQEILLEQRQLGFVQQATATVVGRLDVDDKVSDPNDVRLLVRSLPNPPVIFIDEFDRVAPESDARRLMADTIKLFADTNVESTIVLVGVAESIDELITEHQSIARNIAQIQVMPMTVDELSEIIQKGFERAGLACEKGLDRRIAHLSQGYPHYTHLLGLWAGRRATEAGRLEVVAADLDHAIPDALENASGSVRLEYARAVASGRKDTLYKQVLLACALAPKDTLGRFAAIDVRSHLREITGHDYNTGAYQAHLAKFCEASRGPVLRRTGSRRNYRWQFVNPQLIPYVHLRGIEDGFL